MHNSDFITSNANSKKIFLCYIYSKHHFTLSTGEKQVEITYTSTDRQFFEKYLDDFIPEKLFDMHVHLWTEAGQEHLPATDDPLRYEAGVKEVNDWHSQLFPDRECHNLLLGTPVKEINVRNHNLFLEQEVQKDPLSIAGMLVTPAESPEYLAQCFEKGLFQSVKPYRIFAPDPAEARITEYLPESQIEVIDHYKRAVTLHLSMKDGISSPLNLKELSYLTGRYPNVKWILAHCARAFNANFLAGVIDILKDLPNIFYDTSAVNDLYTHCLLLKHENINRIMFGSDGIVAGGMHGKYITYADAWQYYPGAEKLEHCRSASVTVVYEQLLQQKRAADILSLSQGDIQKLFWGNAVNFIQDLKSDSISATTEKKS